MRFYLFLDDDERRKPPLSSYHKSEIYIVKNVEEAKEITLVAIEQGYEEFFFDLDHDLGEGAPGGDAIHFVDWLIENYRDSDLNFKFRIHSFNPVGAQTMRTCLEKYWEVK